MAESGIFRLDSPWVRCYDGYGHFTLALCLSSSRLWHNERRLWLYYTKGDYAVKLWECTYTLDCKLWTDKSIDYWWSTDGSRLQSTQQRYWDTIHPGYFAVKDFSCEEVQPLHETPRRGRIVERIYK